MSSLSKDRSDTTGRRCIDRPPAIFLLPSNQPRVTSGPFPCTAIRWQIKVGVPRWPCPLSLMTKANANRMFYGIYQVNQDYKNSKLQERHPGFFYILIRSFGLLFSSIFVTLIECTFIEEQHGSTHGLLVVVHNFVWTVVPAASESFKELLEELMDSYCFCQLRNKSCSFVMSTTKDAGSLSCIVWPSYALAFWHDIANSISGECQQYHISPS